MDEWEQLHGILLREHHFQLPLDHSRPEGETIPVFARECISSVMVDKEKEIPWVVFLQGGPGFQSLRPRSNVGWVRRLTQEYRLLLLDQRGTGRSQPITHQTLGQFAGDEKKAEYLTHFRQDSIVRDCELIRKKLVGETEKWGLYGQSFGGFCIMTYFSFAPDSISFALFTGGIPPLLRSPEEVYVETFKVCLKKNAEYYRRFPCDVQRVKEVVDFIENHDVSLPNGDKLTKRRLRTLGFSFYGSGGYETVHWLFESPWIFLQDGKKELSYRFLSQVQAQSPFESNPIYALLHEAIYVQHRASNWAAHRVMESFPQFQDQEKFIFTCEHVFPWLFDELSVLKPLKGAAEILAQKSDWPMIYDPDVLRRVSVPCSAAIYYEDACVVRQFSLEVAQIMPGMRTWVTSDYEHNGSSVDGERILNKLLIMLKEPQKHYI